MLSRGLPYVVQRIERDLSNLALEFYASVKSYIRQNNTNLRKVKLGALGAMNRTTSAKQHHNEETQKLHLLFFMHVLQLHFIELSLISMKLREGSPALTKAAATFCPTIILNAPLQHCLTSVILRAAEVRVLVLTVVKL